MKLPTSHPAPSVVRSAFTLTDLLVLLAGLSLLVCVLTAYLLAAKTNAGLAVCNANLLKISHATLAYATEHQERLPAAVAGDSHNVWWWYKEQVKSYAGLHGESSAQDTLFACPQDRGYSDSTPFHLSGRFDYNSYVFNGVALPGMHNIAGLSLSTINQPKRTLLVMEWTAHAPLSWHRSLTGRRNTPFYCDAKSVVAFADGHVDFIPIFYDGYNAAYTQDPIPGYDYQYGPN